MFDITMFGPAILLVLAALGSSIGCSIASMAGHGAMSRVEEKHGFFVGLAALPGSQAIFGCVLMLLMRNAISNGSITALSGIAIGVCAGLSLCFNSILQGKVVATAIQAGSAKPAVLVKCAAAAGIMETFALFTFVFALLLLSK